MSSGIVIRGVSAGDALALGDFFHRSRPLTPTPCAFSILTLSLGNLLLSLAAARRRAAIAIMSLATRTA